MDILKVLVIIAFVIVTICTIKLHPSIHQPMIIEDADFKLTRISDTITPDTVTTTTTVSEQPKIQTTVQSQDFQTVQQPIERVVQPSPTQNVQTEYVQPENVNTQRQRIKILNRNKLQTGYKMMICLMLKWLIKSSKICKRSRLKQDRLKLDQRKQRQLLNETVVLKIRI